MKNVLLCALAATLFFATSCEKEEGYVEPAFQAPTFSFKKSTTYDDAEVKTPQAGILMFAGDLTINNPENVEITLFCRVRFLQEESIPIAYSAIKSAVTLGGTSTSKRVATQSGTDFSSFDTNKNGTQKVLVTSDISTAMENKMSSSVELTAEYRNLDTGVSHIVTIPVPKGQIITLIK
ncbi:MAG TPA: hypothetical protein VGE18_02755 [Candidatus Paceibacterota bacterium]